MYFIPCLVTISKSSYHPAYISKVYLQDLGSPIYSVIFFHQLAIYQCFSQSLEV